METDNKLNIIVQLTTNLQTKDKQVRIKALNNLLSEINNKKIPLRELFEQTHIQILKCFSDPSEKCREISINLMQQLLSNLDKNDYYLTYIFPTLITRLGDIVIIEESEEIRLQLVKFLRKIIELYQDLITPFFDQCTQILTKTVLDSYAEIKRESCVCISELTKAIPKNFHMQAGNYLKAVCQVLTHQHHKTRVLAIQCVSDIVEHSVGEIMNDVFMLLSCSMNDLVPGVRLAVIRTGHNWLLRQPDRYSYFVKMLPLLLLGLTDESEANAKEAAKLWKEVGEQYAKENEKDLKDKIDYLDEIEEHDDDEEKFGFGCRILVVRHTMHLLNGICNDLSDWKVEIRQMSARLLYTVVAHNESDITQHLQKLLPEIAKASLDSDNKVKDYINKTAVKVGFHVSPKVYCGIILPGIDGQTGPIAGQLYILALLMKRSKRIDLSENSINIVRTLINKDICHCRQYSKEVLSCCEQLIKICQDQCSEIEYELFVLLITISSLNDNTIKSSSYELQLELSTLLQYPSIDDFYKKHSATLLSSLKSSAKIWTVVTPEQCIFETLIQTPANFTENFPIILKILDDCLLNNPDNEVRLKTILSLSKVLIQIEDSKVNNFELLVNDVLTPNLTWHAGRLNESLRSAVVVCLCASLPFCVDHVPDSLANTLLGLLEERSALTRINVLKAIGCIAEAHPNEWSCDVVNKMYPDILRRLDDSVDLVRIQAAITLKQVWASLNSNSYKSETTHSSHLDYLFSTLLIHLDDQNADLQKQVLEALKLIGKLNDNALKTKIEQTKNKFRNQNICEILLESLVIKSEL